MSLEAVSYSEKTGLDGRCVDFAGFDVGTASFFFCDGVAAESERASSLEDGGEGRGVDFAAFDVGAASFFFFDGVATESERASSSEDDIDDSSRTRFGAT
jgi:hypothetical protein